MGRRGDASVTDHGQFRGDSETERRHHAGKPLRTSGGEPGVGDPDSLLRYAADLLAVAAGDRRQLVGTSAPLSSRRTLSPGLWT